MAGNEAGAQETTKIHAGEEKIAIETAEIEAAVEVVIANENFTMTMIHIHGGEMGDAGTIMGMAKVGRNTGVQEDALTTKKMMSSFDDLPHEKSTIPRNFTKSMMVMSPA